MLQVNHLQKIYRTKGSGLEVMALQDVNFHVEEGEFIAIMGESGSGKTTLLNLLAMLDRPTQGQILLDGKDVSSLSDDEQADFRSEHLGYVFQDFNLLDTLNVRENILLPLVLQNRPLEEMEHALPPVVKQLGIEELIKKYPYELSGGQKQRVAIARALIVKPRLILADEPTGALDASTSDQLMKYFDLIHRQGQTILMVTHSSKAASVARRVLFIRDGKIFHQLYRGDKTQYEMMEAISETMTVLARGE